MLSRKQRNPWPIGIGIFFVVFFCGLVTFIVFATTQRVDLVRADYYEEELRFQQQLNRISRAQQMPQPVQVAYDPERQSITIRFPAAPPPTANRISGRIHLYRPSDARLDQEVPLSLASDGTQRLDAGQLRSGLWKLRLTWTRDGQEFFFDQPVVIQPRA